MQPFTSEFAFQGLPTRVVSGVGAIQKIAAELDGMNAKRVMVVSGPNTSRSRLYADIVQSFGERVSILFDRVPPHSDTDLVNVGAKEARQGRIDLLLAIGGGSASDTAKAIAIVLGEGGGIEDHANEFIPPDRYIQRALPADKLPIVVVPTTASAAEVTPGLGIRHPSGRKLLFWDIRLWCKLLALPYPAIPMNGRQYDGRVSGFG